MSYFNYHATAKRLIEQGKLKAFYFTQDHNGIRPALVLIFDCAKHSIMPIRKDKFDKYLCLLEQKGLLDKQISSI